MTALLKPVRSITGLSSRVRTQRTSKPCVPLVVGNTTMLLARRHLDRASGRNSFLPALGPVVFPWTVLKSRRPTSVLKGAAPVTRWFAEKGTLNKRGRVLSFPSLQLRGERGDLQRSGDTLMNDDDKILTWFSDGSKLSPVTREQARKTSNPTGKNYQQWKHRQLERNRRREKWLNRIHKKELPRNHVNDKRKYYRQEYLKSEHWRLLKQQALLRYNSCGICGNHSVDVHHVSYRNLYDVTLEDLRTVCRRCHSEIHRLIENGTLRLSDRMASSWKWSLTRQAVLRSLAV